MSKAMSDNPYESPVMAELVYRPRRGISIVAAAAAAISLLPIAEGLLSLWRHDIARAAIFLPFGVVMLAASVWSMARKETAS